MAEDLLYCLRSNGLWQIQNNSINMQMKNRVFVFVIKLRASFYLLSSTLSQFTYRETFLSSLKSIKREKAKRQAHQTTLCNQILDNSLLNCTTVQCLTQKFKFSSLISWISIGDRLGKLKSISLTFRKFVQMKEKM